MSAYHPHERSPRQPSALVEAALPSLTPSPRRWRLGAALLLWPLLVWTALMSCGPGELPVLDTIEPKQAYAGKETLLLIYGQSFPEGDLKVSLVGRSNRIELGSPRRVDATKIEVKLPTDAAPGPYDLELVFGDQKPLILGGAFEVIAQALQVYFIEVGQGDATLLVSPAKKTMLIDAGPPGQAPQIHSVLQKLGITHLDHAIATHYDADHVGSFEDVVNGPDGKAGTKDDVEIREGLWDPGGFSKNRSYVRVRTRFSSVHKGLTGSSDASFPTIDLGGGVTIQVRTANGVVKAADGSTRAISCGDDSNCQSIGTLVQIGKIKMWTAGDLTGGGNSTPDVESELAKSIGKVDIYRSHHHGSKTSSNEALLKALSPQVIVVSAGKDNSYCHPHASILSRYVSLKDVWIFVTSDGVISPQDCGKTTADRLSDIGNRAVIPAGTFRLTMDPTGFSAVISSETEPIRWRAR